MRDRVLTEQGEVRPHVNLFVGAESSRWSGGLAMAVPPGAEISILPAVSGGAPGAGGAAGVSVHDAGPEDMATIRDVTLAAYGEYASEIPAFWDAYRQNILTTLASPGPAAQIVAELDGTIVGTVLLYPAGASAYGTSAKLASPEVRLLAVVPEARGHGIGLVLMQECIERARRSGAGSLTLHTTDMMRSAMRLYARMGFVPAPELDFHPAPRLTVKGFRLQLPR